MAVDRSPASSTVGFSLLPSELLEDIFLRLAVPDLLRLNSVSRTILSFVSGEDFRRLYARRSASDTWVFLYQKGSSRHHSVLLGFSDRLSRWCRIPIAAALLPAVLPGEDLYFLAAAGDVFVFASNYLGELVAVDLAGNRVKRVPPSPLGRRRTSSWRRSGLKLFAGAGKRVSFSLLRACRRSAVPVLLLVGDRRLDDGGGGGGPCRRGPRPCLPLRGRFAEPKRRGVSRRRRQRRDAGGDPAELFRRSGGRRWGCPASRLRRRARGGGEVGEGQVRAGRHVRRDLGGRERGPALGGYYELATMGPARDGPTSIWRDDWLLGGEVWGPQVGVAVQ